MHTYYARCHGLANFNSAVTFNPAIVLHMSQSHALWFFKLCLNVQIFSWAHYPLKLLPWHITTTKGSWWLLCMYITATVQHFCSTTWPNILGKLVSRDYRVYCKEFYFRHHCTYRTQEFSAYDETFEWKDFHS